MATDMVRTQIYLSGEQRRLLKQRAEQTGTTMCAVIREAVDRFLTEKEEPGVFPVDDPVFDLVGKFDSGQDGGAAEHDRHLYHLDRERR